MASHATAVFLGKHCPTPYDKTSHEITGGFAEPYCASTIRCYICCEFSSPSPGGILPQEMVHIPSNPSSLLQESVVERKKHQERLQALLVGWKGCLRDGTYLAVCITAVSTLWLGGVRALTPGNGRGPLDLTGRRLQVLLLPDGTLSTECDVACRLERQALPNEDTLLELDVAVVAHGSLPQHNIEGQHGKIGVQPCSQVRCPVVTVHVQLPECRCVGTNRLALEAGLNSGTTYG